MKEKIFNFSNGSIKLTKEEMKEVAEEYGLMLYMEDAVDKVSDFSEYADKYDAADLDYVGAEVYDRLYCNDLIYDLIEYELWLEVIAEQDEEISNRDA